MSTHVEPEGLTPLDCLAVVILQQARPGAILPLWLCTRTDLREAALAEARGVYERWKTSELDALAARDASEQRALKPRPRDGSV